MERIDIGEVIKTLVVTIVFVIIVIFFLNAYSNETGGYYIENPNANTEVENNYMWIED